MNYAPLGLDPSSASFSPIEGLATGFPTDGLFVSWPQTGGIFKAAPHPEGAKLLHGFMLSPEYQTMLGWSVRQDVPPPPGFPDIMHVPSTNPTEFARFMEDRATVERLRFWFEDRLGTAQGQSPLVDETLDCPAIITCITVHTVYISSAKV